MKTYRSSSSEETKKIGEKLGRALARGGTGDANGAMVLALKGELGSGKTTFVQGFFHGLGLKKRAQSPTFIIMRRYGLSRGKFSNVFHVDAYRLKKAAHLKALDFTKILSDPKNIVLVEWADRVKEILPSLTGDKGRIVWLEFRHGKKENERKIMIRERKKR